MKFSIYTAEKNLCIFYGQNFLMLETGLFKEILSINIGRFDIIRVK